LNWLPPGESAIDLLPPIALYGQVVGHLASLGFGGETQPQVAQVHVDPPLLAAGPAIG
jgi:hypothetical protein